MSSFLRKQGTNWIPPVCLLLFSFFLLSSCNDKEIVPPSPELIKRFNQATVAFSKSDFQRAMIWTDSTLAEQADYQKAIELKGDLFRELRLFQQSDSCYREVLKLNKNAKGLWFKIGINAFLVEKYNEAIGHFENELELSDSKPIEVTAQIGRSYALQGDRNKAKSYFDQVLAQDSSFAAIYPWLADIAEEDGAMEKAYLYSRKSLALQGPKPELLYKMGLLAQRTQRYEEAELLLRRVIQIEPSHEGAHYQLGMALNNLDRGDEAKYFLTRTDSLQNLYSKIATAKLSADNHASNPAEWIRLSKLYKAIGKDEEARVALKRAEYWAIKSKLIPQN